MHKKKVSEREVKSGGVAQLHGSKEPFQLSTRSNSGGSIWMPSQVRFQRKKQKVKERRRDGRPVHMSDVLESSLAGTGGI